MIFKHTMKTFMQLYIFVCYSLAILKRLLSKRLLSPLVDGHKLTYLVLTCRKTLINQSINQSILMF